MHILIHFLNVAVKLQSVEALCVEPGCLKIFTNEQCLRDHIQLCHQHITCQVCGAKHLKRNIKRHLRTHEKKVPVETIECLYKGCRRSFSTVRFTPTLNVLTWGGFKSLFRIFVYEINIHVQKSNYSKHLKGVHFKQRPYVCGFSGCGKRFSYKHVRDNHEKRSCHIYTHVSFVFGVTNTEQFYL